ncbi:MAG: M55 family metallopeptidase [Anaerolineae bacterium]|nr:M55 family metallopeptidase [Anaerolineae bacterium]
MSKQNLKILIAVDMEGISGITYWDQVTPGHAEYLSRGRQLMTDDVNAAIAGLAEGGASEFVVSDGHWNGSNILIESLDPRARLNFGSPSPRAMMQGIDQQPAAVVLVGYHAMAGTAYANLDHTWSDYRIQRVYLNDRQIGEIGLNGALAGYYGVPIIAATGDQSACGEARDFFGDALEMAVVKTATGQFSAECLPLVESRRRIHDAMHRAVQKLKQGHAPSPFVVGAPVRLAVEFLYSRHADRAHLMPGTERLSGTRIEYVAPDMPTAYRAFRALSTLARD